MINRRNILLGGTSAIAIASPNIANAAWASFKASTPPPATATATWQPLRVGGGGFTRDMDMAPDGTKVCRVDVYGAYVYNPSIPNPGNAGGMGCWQQLCLPPNIPSGDPAYTPSTLGNFYTGGGAWEIRIAPSNSSVIYMVWLGMMYKSVNKGLTFVNQTDNVGGTFPLQTVSNSNPNSPYNGPGPAMAIDPQNPNICWVGTVAGVYHTADGGTTWSTVSTSTLPLPGGSSSNGTYGFAFDKQSAVTGGATQGLYVSVNNTGIYHSANAGSTFALLSGTNMPTATGHIVCDQFGVLWASDANAAKVSVYTVQSVTHFTANTWTQTAANAGGNVWTIAPDPASTTSATQRIVVGNGGILTQSLDGGTTWQQDTGEQFNQVATDIPWLQTNELDMPVNGNMYFDPSATNMLYFPEGIGMWVASPPVTKNLAATSNSGGSYNSTTGVVTIAISADIGAASGSSVFVWGLTGTGSIGQITNGTFTAVSGTSGTTLAYQAPTGLTLTINNVSFNGNFMTWFWNSVTSGIESLETAAIITPPGGGVGLCQWDRDWFLLSNSNVTNGVFPSTYGTWPGNRANDNTSQSVIFGGWGADWAAGNPSFIALNQGGLGSTAGQTTGSGFSTNGGVPVTGWSFFATLPSYPGPGAGAAAIAVSTSSSMMQVSGTGGLYATTDGGNTWTNVTPAGSTTAAWGSGFAQTSRTIAADKVTANYYVGVNVSAWYSSNSGTSWTQSSEVFSFGGSNGGGIQVSAIPGHAGHFFMTGGGSGGPAVDNSNIFYRSTDGGVTWADVSQAGYTVREVWMWGFGAPQSPGTYPTIFIYGYVNGVGRGVFQSIDNCATWQQIGNAQFGPVGQNVGLTFDWPNCMAGDMNVPGQCYVGFIGCGYVFYGVKA